MNDTEERKTTEWDLSVVLRRFTDSNRHSPVVETRWLVDTLAETQKIVDQVRDGTLHRDFKEKVRSFRLGEIRDEQDQLRKRIDALTAEATRANSD